MDNPKVSIVILNWNGIRDTIECLNSLKHITYTNHEIILVDNGSTDGSVEQLKKTYPEIEIIENQENLGFAEGNNIAIKRVIERGTKYILMLNNDTIVDPGFLSHLVSVLESDVQIGIVGPTVYHYGKKDQIQSAGGRIVWNKGITYHFTDKQIILNNTLRNVDYIMGCALLTRAELFIKNGYLDKDYFAYWEETEWCVRAKKSAYKIVHVPAARVWHKGGSTAKKSSGFYDYHMTRNMFWFMKTHSNGTQYILFLLYFFGFKFWLLTSFYIYGKNLKTYKYFLKGILDGNKIH